MIAIENREAVRALSPSLRKLLETATVTADQLASRRERHEVGHHCDWYASGTAHQPRPYCAVNQLLMQAWSPLYRFAKCLEYFLVGGKLPSGYEDELAAPCDYCEERPGILDNPDPKKKIGKVCQSCHDSLDADREERDLIEASERREEEPWNRADHERDMAKDRAIEGDR
jgi:hypothetical protein